MRLRRRYSLPELLTLLSYGQGHPGFSPWRFAQQPGIAKLRQVIHLAKEGLREYNHRLDDLERNVSHESYSRRRDNGGDDDECQRVEDDVIDAEAAEPERLTRREVHHVFEKLGIHRHSLNARGYPYTSDVNEERERIYPDSEWVDGRDVEAAWDDWRNEDGKRLFRAHRRDPDAHDDERDRDEHHDGRHRGNWREGETRDRANPPMLQEELEVFSRMLRDAAERAFEGFNRSRNDREQVSRNGPERRERGDTPSESRPSPNAERLFRVFDEILLSADRAKGFTTENLPKLSDVNRRLAERGESELDDEALGREWMAYLVTSAFAREEQVRRRRPNGGSDVSHDDPRVEVELDATVVEQESGAENGRSYAKPGNGRKRKPV